MATLEERVAYLEGQVNGFIGLQETLTRFEQRVDRRFEAVDRRLEAVDDKLSRQFQWLVGLQITMLLAVVGALLARS